MKCINEIMKIIKKEDGKMKFETVANEWLEYKKTSIQECELEKYVV